MSGLEGPSDGERKKERWPGEKQDIEAERIKLREEIRDLRAAADEKEGRFEELVRWRAEMKYGERLKGMK